MFKGLKKKFHKPGKSKHEERATDTGTDREKEMAPETKPEKMEPKDKYLLVAAIDFGTTFSGYAFSFKSTKDDPELHEKIRMNNNWGESLGFQSHKTPTSVLTTSSGEFVAFGYEAEDQYSEALDEDEGAAQKMLLFRHFKMMLHKTESVKRTALIASVDGTIHPALEIFAFAIRYLKDELLKTLSKESGMTIDESLIRWVLTVPAIWSDESKQFMREAAYKAGCILGKNSDQLVIALEPEAASLCCRRLNIAQYSSDAGISFPVDTKYIVLDCGGGTVDITAHKIEPNHEVKELKVASGGPWGGTEVDKNFIAFLCSIFGVNFMNEYQKECPQEWLGLMVNFDRVKRSLKPDGKSKLNVQLPYCMGSLFADRNGGKRIEKAIQEQSENGIGFASGSLSIKHEAALKFFDPVVQNIVQHVRTLLQDPKLKPIDFIFMVGGFSECSILQDAIEKAFGGNGLRILIPSSAQLAILKGAVLYGHNQAEISQRIARFTYGSCIAPLFDPAIHNPQYKYFDPLDEVRCARVIAVYIEKGEEIQTGETRVFFCNVQPTENETQSIVLYAMDGAPVKPVQYVTDPRVKQIGTIIVNTPFQAKKKNRKCKITIESGGTEIKIEAEFVATGEKASTTLDFLQ